MSILADSSLARLETIIGEGLVGFEGPDFIDGIAISVMYFVLMQEIKEAKS